MIVLIASMIAFFIIYLLFGFWFSYIIFSPPPRDSKKHSKIELQINWKSNRPPIFWENSALNFFVGNNLLFFWGGSIQCLILIYMLSNSLIMVLVGLILIFLLAFISLRLMKWLTITTSQLLKKRRSKKETEEIYKNLDEVLKK